MPASSFSQLSKEILVVIFLAIIAAFLAGVSVGRRFGPSVGIGVEVVPPIGPIEDRVVPPEEGGGVACTMEAKLCPDGSYVGRTGPNCEFTPCPGEVQ